MPTRVELEEYESCNASFGLPFRDSLLPAKLVLNFDCVMFKTWGQTGELHPWRETKKLGTISVDMGVRGMSTAFILISISVFPSLTVCSLGPNL